MTTIKDLPKDIIKLLLAKHLHPLDAIHCIKVSKKVFWSVYTKDKHLQRIIEKRIYYFWSYDRYLREIQRHQSFDNPKNEPIVVCKYCDVVVKKKNIEKHINKIHLDKKQIERVECEMCMSPIKKEKYSWHKRFKCPARIIKCQDCLFEGGWRKHIEKCIYKSSYLRVRGHRKYCTILCWGCGKRIKNTNQDRWIHRDCKTKQYEKYSFDWFLLQTKTLINWVWRTIQPHPLHSNLLI